MLERTAQDNWQDQLVLAVDQRGVHESAGLGSSRLLAANLVQNDSHLQVQRLLSQVDYAVCDNRAAIDFSFQVGGFGYAVFQTECAGKLDQAGSVLGFVRER